MPRAYARPLLLALALLVAACGGRSDVQKGTAQGTVVAVDTAANEVTLDHGEISGIMSAMTMSFPVADPKLLAGLAPGTQVEFDLEYAGGKYLVRDIRRR